MFRVRATLLAASLALTISWPAQGEDCGVLKAQTINYPVRTWSDYHDDNPFLAEVWFTCSDDNQNGRMDCRGLGGLDHGDSAEECTNQDRSRCHFRKAHLGSDINSDDGTDRGDDVYAIGPGKVTYSGKPYASMGNVVIISHKLADGRTVNSMYAHLLDRSVSQGVCVTSGTVIGHIGDADGRYDPHLHFEVRTEQAMERNAGFGYEFLHDKEAIRPYTDPILFIRGIRGESVSPVLPSNQQPNGSQVNVPICHLDNGTTATGGDTYAPCLKWEKNANTVFSEVYLDGYKLGRSYGNTIPLNQTLIPSIKHHWYIAAHNFLGKKVSPVRSFTLTSGGVGGSGEDPATNAITGRAENIREESARLTGEVIPYGSSTEIYFEYGTTRSYGRTSLRVDAGRGYKWKEVSRTIRTLACDTRYHYRLVSENARGQVSRGGDRSFSTDSCSAPSAPQPPDVNLALDSIDCGKISLRWDIDEGGHYALHRDGIEIWDITTTGDDGVQLFKDDEGLIAGEGYDYSIQAVNEHGSSIDAVHVFYPPYICGGEGHPPSEFILQVTSQLQRCDGNSPAVLLEWTPLYDSDTLYRIYKTDGTLLGEVDAAQDGPVYVLREGLVPGQSYGFYVEGYDHQGNAVRTNTIRHTSQATAARSAEIPLCLLEISSSGTSP